MTWELLLLPMHLAPSVGVDAYFLDTYIGLHLHMIEFRRVLFSSVHMRTRYRTRRMGMIKLELSYCTTLVSTKILLSRKVLTTRVMNQVRSFPPNIISIIHRYSHEG